MTSRTEPETSHPRLAATSIRGWDVSFRDAKWHRTSDGTRLAYKVRGEGPVVTLVNSTLHTSSVYALFTRKLAEQFTVVTYDLRNQGRSSNTGGTFRDHISDLSSLHAALGVDQSFLLGHSIGTHICVAYALSFPESTRGLILSAPVINPSRRALRLAVYESWRKIAKQGGPGLFFDAFFPIVMSEEMAERGGPEAHEAMREIWLETFTEERVDLAISHLIEAEAQAVDLAAVTAPTLLIAGSTDAMVTRGALEECLQLLPAGGIAVIPGAGHIPHFDDPEAFQARILEQLGIWAETEKPR